MESGVPDEIEPDPDDGELELVKEADKVNVVKHEGKTGRRRRRLLLGGAVGLLVLAIAAIPAMVWLPDPTFPDPPAYTLEDILAEGMTVEQVYEFEPLSFSMSDGAILNARRFASDSPDTILFLHGANGFSNQLNRALGMLREATGAEVITYDHRGHGQSDGRRGHLDHIGQYEEDLGEVVASVRRLRPSGRIILAGHSMGGAILQRYALRDDQPEVDAHILFTPAMGRDLPERSDALGPSIFKPHVPRIIGLQLLNALGIRAWNDLPVLFLDLPHFDGHIDRYSYNAALSILPEDYAAGIAAIDKPLLVVLGRDDRLLPATEAVANAFREYGHAELLILDDEGHHVQNNPAAIDAISDWMTDL